MFAIRSIAYIRKIGFNLMPTLISRSAVMGGGGLGRFQGLWSERGPDIKFRKISMKGDRLPHLEHGFYQYVNTLFKGHRNHSGAPANISSTRKTREVIK